MTQIIANPASDMSDVKFLGRLAEWYRRMRESGLTLDDLQRPIDDSDFRIRLVDFWRGGAFPATHQEANAIKILGADRVITMTQACYAWGYVVPRDVPVIGYSDELLEEVAIANEKFGTAWYLVYAYGISFLDQRKIVGSGEVGSARHHNRLFERAEISWTGRKPVAGYYLIDFEPRWRNCDWEEQSRRFKLENECERADEAIVAEAVVSIWKVHKERNLRLKRHMGRSLTSDGRHVCVGPFGPGSPLGLNVSRVGDHESSSDLGVCHFRKHDLLLSAQ